MKELMPAVRTASFGFIVLATAMGIGRFAFTPLLPMMRAEDLLGMSAAGWLSAVHFLGYAMGAFFARYLTGSPRRALITSLVAIGMSTLAMGLTESFPFWALARWIAGVCSAFVLVLVSNHVVENLTQAKRSDLHGMVFAGVGVGITLVGLLTLGLMALKLPSWLGWIIFGFISLCVAGLTIQGSPLSSDTSERLSRDPSSPVRVNWSLTLPYGAMGFGYVVPATYLPSMAQATISSPLIFGWSWPIFGAAAALATILAARLASSLPDRTIWFVSQLVMATGLLLPALWPQLGTVIIGGICVGGAFMVITMVGMKEAHRVAGERDATPQIAAMTAAFAIGQMIGPAIAGAAYDVSQSFTFPLILASGCLASTAFILRGGPAMHVKGETAR